MLITFPCFSLNLLRLKQGGSPYALYVAWLQPAPQPVLRVGVGPQVGHQEALHQRVMEGAWVAARPLGVVDQVVVGGLEGQP